MSLFDYAKQGPGKLISFCGYTTEEVKDLIESANYGFGTDEAEPDELESWEEIRAILIKIYDIKYGEEE